MAAAAGHRVGHGSLMVRTLCPRCERPQNACICTWVTPTANQARVLILQHPLEVKQAKGSARLLQLSLQDVDLQVGETFDPQALRLWLHGGVPPEAPSDSAEPASSSQRTVLLYPAHAELPAPTADLSEVHPSDIRLVVLDGTWRKSLKMLHLNPALQSLPRMSLNPDSPSRYLIRKAHRPDQLSTLEACCLALAQLEHAPDRYEALLTAFSSFVSAQLRHKEPV